MEITTVLSRSGKEKGKVINQDVRMCRLEGCNGYVSSVRWEDGKLTYPCSKGMKQIDENTMQII